MEPDHKTAESETIIESLKVLGLQARARENKLKTAS